MGTHVGDRAVVLGGSITGLFAAHALAEAYREVVVVDRDQLIGVAGMRRSVPQSFHAQALLGSGQVALEELFPGITAELSAAGVPTGDIGDDIRWCFDGQLLEQAETGMVCLASPRLILESHVRTKVMALPNVVFVEYCDILGLIATADRDRISGVRVHQWSKGAAEEVLDADLVVDTTGRGSRTPVWLEEFGYPRVPEDQVKIGLGYSTRHYRLPSDTLGKDLALVLVPTPANKRGAIFAKEGALPDGGERFLLTLNGVLGDHPPTDPDGFLEFARSLPVPDIYEAIRAGEPLDDPVAFKFPASRWRRYEQMNRLPDRLLVMGDAVHSPNPVYAQPISISAMEALVLRRHLRAGTPPPPRKFFQEIAGIIDGAWEITTAADLAHPEIEGVRSAKLRLANSYLARLRQAAVHDGALSRAFLRVAGLVDPAEALMRPGTVMRVLRHSRRGPNGAQEQMAAPGNHLADPAEKAVNSA